MGYLWTNNGSVKVLTNLSTIGKITAATGLVSLAGQLLRKKGPLWDIFNGLRDTSAADKGHQLLDMIQRADRTGANLAQYTQQMRIVTRVFADSSITEEPIFGNLLRALRGWYVAQNLAALQLQQLVSKGVSVQDVLGVVQTGDNPHYHNAGLSAFRRFAGLASLTENYGHLSASGMSSEAAAWVPPMASHADPQVQAFIKKMMASSAGKSTAQISASMMAAMQSAMATPNGQQTVTNIWSTATDWLKANVSGKMADRATIMATSAALTLAGNGIKKAYQSALNKADPDNITKLDADLHKARTKEDLLGIADKYHLDRRLVEKRLDELWAPINVDPQKVDLEKLNGIATGELFNITMTNPDHPDASFTVPLFIQMTPISVPFRVAPRFIDMMTTPSVWQRWTMMTAGEIEFFRDFIGQRDRVMKRISQDDTESLRALKEFLATIRKKDQYSLSDIASSRSTGNMSHNLANSVLVFSEDTVRQAYADSGVDLHNDDDRKRYFEATYSMIIAIIDPAFADVSVYINGISGRINFKYSALKPADKKFDPVDLIAAMQALGSGKAPTIR